MIGRKGKQQMASRERYPKSSTIHRSGYAILCIYSGSRFPRLRFLDAIHFLSHFLLFPFRPLRQLLYLRKDNVDEYSRKCTQDYHECGEAWQASGACAPLLESAPEVPPVYAEEGYVIL